jgi:hypothetical protein
MGPWLTALDMFANKVTAKPVLVALREKIATASQGVLY